MRALITAILSICIFVCECPEHAGALDCAKPYWWNFDRIDGDPQKQREDAEARAALANLGPIVFRGRFAWARDLSDIRKNQSEVFLIVFRDVEVLRGAMPGSPRDRKVFLVFHAWCGTRCGPASQWWPHQLTTFSARPFNGGPIKELGGDIVYKGRVDAEMGACDQIQLTPLQEQLLHAPADEITRLIREYPFHPIREAQPTDPH